MCAAVAVLPLIIAPVPALSAAPRAPHAQPLDTSAADLEPDPQYAPDELVRLVLDALANND